VRCAASRAPSIPAPRVVPSLRNLAVPPEFSPRPAPKPPLPPTAGEQLVARSLPFGRPRPVLRSGRGPPSSRVQTLSPQSSPASPPFPSPMELFAHAKVVRLRSHHDKFLYADEDEVRVTQDRDGSSANARWTVEAAPHSAGVVRLRSRYGRYLTASGEPFLLGMKGRKVTQMAPRQRVRGLGAHAGRLPGAPPHQGGPLPPRQRGPPALEELGKR
jgi:hypothetical protein